jgi:hypothetical protein
MNDAQEVFLDVLQGKDGSNIDRVVASLQSVPSLDPKADELRNRLLALFLKAKGELTASPTPKSNQKPTTQANSDLIKAFSQWTRDYNEWLKGAAEIYLGQLS